ncbi:MAG: hypothetical protein ACLFQL_07565 [Paracoccaceae bacterium]
MKRIDRSRAGRGLVLVALLVGSPALFAQGFDTLADEAYEAMPEEAPLPLEQLVDTDAPLPELPDLDFDAPVSADGAADETVHAEDLWAEAGLPEAVPVEDDEASRDTADAVEGAGMAPLAPPGDWVWHDFEGTRFAVPGAWAVMEEDDLELVVFSGDIAPPTGHILMIRIDDGDGDSIDEMIASAVEEGGMLAEQGEIALPGGELFDWADLEVNLDGVAMDMRLYVSRSMFTQDRAPIVISAATVGGAAPLDPALRETFLASFRFGSSDAAGTAQGDRDVPETESVAGTAGAGPDQDSFVDIGGGYTTYRNARYGTQVSYPGTYFIAQPAPDSGDGRRFEAADGQARFIVFTQYDALERGLAGMQAEIRAELDDVRQDSAAPGVFEIAGTEGETRRVFKVIRDADGLTRRLEITYPLAREAEFEAVVAYMARSFGPPPELSVAVPQPPGRVMVPPPPDTGAAPESDQAPQEGRVADFANGQSNGWTGLLTELRPRMTGGPDGRGYLESLSPGDGHDGYYVAPEAFHGDWRGLRSIEVQIRADSGEFYGETGRGGADIVIEGAGGAARTGFDVPIGRAWMTQRVRLDDAGRWKLTRGASRLEDVLADVTGFRIRAEYILGDTSGGLARVTLAGWAVGAGPGAGPETPQRGVSPVPLGEIFTPDRGTALRGALMDAAREPVQREIGVPILFVVDVLNTDGTWAYLQGHPVNSNGSDIDWSRTRFAHEMAGGFMSDVVMVLLRNEAGRWTVVDHVLGPTDVAWYDWVAAHGLPEWFFRN